MEKTNVRIKSHDRIVKLIVLALFTALAYVSLFVCHFRVEFLSFEPKDAIIVLSAFMYGPLAGVEVAVVTAVIEMFTISSTGLYGLVMNIASSCVFSAVAGLIYKYKKTITGAVIGLLAAIISMTAVMIVANIVITPFYMGAPRQAVIDLIIPLLLPFNIVKGIFSASLAMILYKPFVTALRATGVVPTGYGSYKPGKKSIAVTIISIAVAAGAVIYFLVVLEGAFGLK